MLEKELWLLEVFWNLLTVGKKQPQCRQRGFDIVHLFSFSGRTYESALKNGVPGDHVLLNFINRHPKIALHKYKKERKRIDQDRKSRADAVGDNRIAGEREGAEASRIREKEADRFESHKVWLSLSTTRRMMFNENHFWRRAIARD